MPVGVILKEIEQILNFIIEIEKLKDVHRKTRPVGMDRYENSAEHSWHVCLSALMLKDYANEAIDINRVMKMLLIHDLGEIDAGDTIIYDSESEELKNKEAEGVKRILKLLPSKTSEEYINLWHEFEAGKTTESIYAKAIDRIPPLLHNLYGDGHSWNEHNIPKEKVFAINSRINNGCSEVWKIIETKLNEAFDQGILKKT